MVGAIWVAKQGTEKNLIGLFTNILTSERRLFLLYSFSYKCIVLIDVIVLVLLLSDGFPHANITR